MLQSTFTGIAFRRGEKRLKWQRLDACLPWQWCEKREAEPPQATGFDKMTATGAHRVTIDPARVNLWELHAKVRKWRAELGKCRAGSGNVWICQQNRHGILHHQRTFIYNHWESRSKHISCALSHVIPQSLGPNGVLWCHQGRQRLVPLRPDLSREVGEVFSTIHSVPTGRD